MLKLARNALASLQILESSKGLIKWQQIVNLHTLQTNITLKYKKKLNAQCIAWEQNKMEVKYAAQTLSSSVANALEFLQMAFRPEFKDCEATIQFLRTIDRLFDFLNSRSPFGTGFKEPLKPSNLKYPTQIMHESIQYLLQVRDKSRQLLHNGTRRAFVYGFAITTKSIISIAESLFVENPSFTYLLIYKFSQDHIGLLFVKIRSRYGWNNKSNVIEFRNAIRQILIKNSLVAGKSLFVNGIV